MTESWIPDEPACWSWQLPTTTRESEVEGLRAVSHGLSDAAIDMMLAFWSSYLLKSWQAGRCAVCGRVPGLAHPRLAEDHDHRTGLVRGWLCRSCNSLEGRRTGGVWAAYRERHPAQILGVRIYYVGYTWTDRWWNNPTLARYLTGDPEWVRVDETD